MRRESREGTERRRESETTLSLSRCHGPWSLSPLALPRLPLLPPPSTSSSSQLTSASTTTTPPTDARPPPPAPPGRRDRAFFTPLGPQVHQGHLPAVPRLRARLLAHGRLDRVRSAHQERLPGRSRRQRQVFPTGRPRSRDQDLTFGKALPPRAGEIRGSRVRRLPASFGFAGAGPEEADRRRACDGRAARRDLHPPHPRRAGVRGEGGRDQGVPTG